MAVHYGSAQQFRGAYNGLHRRLAKVRGRAAAHLCIDCGASAQQWSYNNSGISEITYRTKRFSTDIEQYDPRCIGCHKAFDAAFRRSRGYTPRRRTPRRPRPKACSALSVDAILAAAGSTESFTVAEVHRAAVRRS